MIDANELREAMKKEQSNISDDEIEKMFQNIDYQGNKKLNYTEFIAATLSVK